MLKLSAVIASMPALVMLSACAGVAADRPATLPSDALCKQEPGAAFIGRSATAEVGAALLAATGARTLRWVPPRTAVTMDYRAERLTVAYDDGMIITQVSCG